VGASRRLTRDEVRVLERCIARPHKQTTGKKGAGEPNARRTSARASSSAPASRRVRAGAKRKPKPHTRATDAGRSAKRTTDRKTGRAKRNRRT
jgi:hypothetical protein